MKQKLVENKLEANHLFQKFAELQDKIKAIRPNSATPIQKIREMRLEVQKGEAQLQIVLLEAAVSEIGKRIAGCREKISATPHTIPKHSGA